MGLLRQNPKLMEPVNPHESNVVPKDSVQKRYIDRTLGALSIAFGVLTVIIGFIPCIGWLAFGPGTVGLIIGFIGLIMAKKAGVPAKLAMWGIALNVLGLLAVIILNLWLSTGLNVNKD